MICIDTNIWIYLFSEQDSVKRQVVRELISSLSPRHVVISNQIYKEIANVLIRRLNLPKEYAFEILSRIEKIASVYPEMPSDIKTALEIKDRYNLQFFDSVIYAFCLRNNIQLLISEDKPLEEIEHKGKILKLFNPFEE